MDELLGKRVQLGGTSLVGIVQEYAHPHLTGTAWAFVKIESGMTVPFRCSGLRILAD